MAVRTPRRGASLRARWALAVTSALALVVGGPALAASATEPLPLGSGYVTDQAGVLAPAEAGSSQVRLAELYDETGIDLYVAIVDEFTSPADSQEWADAVAERNGLGTTQYLLAVSVENPQYYISADSSGPLSDDQLTAIERDIRPFLSARDYAGAIDAAATGFASAASGSGGGSGPNPLLPSVYDTLMTGLFVLAAIAVVVVIVVLLLRARRKRAVDPAVAPAGAPETPQVPTEELARQAASALIDTDDAIRTSEQELGFATAQFGDEATREFAAALQSAREKLGQAFTLQQQLDDETADTEEQVRAWNTQIAQLCAEANQGLDDKAEAFDELRKLEQEAPAALTRVRDARTAAASALDAAAEKLASLQGTYTAEALETIDDNVDQARARLAFAEEQLTAAQTALDAGDTGEAAVGIRAGEEAVGQAVLLEDAIGALAGSLDDAATQAARLVDEIERDVRTASTLPDPDGRVAAVLEVTRADLDDARGDLAGALRHPLGALQTLQATDQRIDEVMQAVRDAAARTERLGQQVAAEIAGAQSQVSAAESFITARRGAVGTEARTRLAEAGASLSRAQQLQSVAPDQALQEAQRATALAGEAIRYARTDVGGFASPGGAMTGGGGAGSSFVGALLGGIVSEAFFGGGGSSRTSGLGGGFGGGFGGFSGGSSRGGGGRSSFRSGSFGGGGTRGRRGGGRY